jgi:DNA-binding NarL/FixJ family response regulator
MKIVIIEDHLIIREAVRRACIHEFGHEVVGETEFGAAGVQLVSQLKPDLVILDLGLPDMDGFAVASVIMRVLPATRILVLSGLLDDYTVFRVEKAGLHGFVDKTSNTIAHVRGALDALSAGRTYFSPAFNMARLARRTDTASFEKVLSESEQEVLSLVGEGLTDEEIGIRLGISPSTAQTHRSNILQKLHIKGTPKLVAFAIRHGFTRMPGRPSGPRH